ncbi:hypothetical protein LWI29_017354 [Acer saccharum]|uniref:Uncharacterized protein n=1 Tax=Acer saccharum TaxID=4024 RepID=A0AA39W6I9_ACESA|nr:hypothetical protein LWI29_017354 [Acer saccharum]
MVVLRSGKVLGDSNKEATVEENGVVQMEGMGEKELEKEDEVEVINPEPRPQLHKSPNPYVPPIPFPGSLKNSKLEKSHQNSMTHSLVQLVLTTVKEVENTKSKVEAEYLAQQGGRKAPRALVPLRRCQNNYAGVTTLVHTSTVRKMLPIQVFVRKVDVVVDLEVIEHGDCSVISIINDAKKELLGALVTSKEKWELSTPWNGVQHTILTDEELMIVLTYDFNEL